MKKQRKSSKTSMRWRLVLLAAAFAAPIIASYTLYYSGWRPESTQSYGELVTPARPVADVELSMLDGGTASFSTLRGRWLLLYFGSGECGSVCERALYKMRQVIAAQGREASRARAAMVVTDARGLDVLRYQLKDYPGVTTFVGPPAAVTQLASQFQLPAGSALSGLHRIYVVDPLGNFLMSYPADADPSGIRKDLARLLRASHIG